MFYNEKLSKKEAYHVEPGLYSSKADLVKAMNTITHERNNSRDTCIPIKFSSVTQKVKVYLANEESSLASFINDLGHIFGGDVQNDLGKPMHGKSPNEPSFAYDIVRMRSLKIYTADIVEYKIVGNRENAFASLLSVHIEAQIW